MVVDGRDTRRRATYEGHYGLMGETPAHQVTGHLLVAVKALMTSLVGLARDERRDACLDAIDQALAWLPDADMVALDRRSRWVFAVEWSAYLNVIEGWYLAHRSEHQAELARRVLDMLGDIGWDLYASYDHWMRLNDDGLISDHLLRRRMRTLRADECRTPEDLPQHLRDVRAGVAALPPSRSGTATD